MPVMIEVTNPLAREQTMTKTEDRSKIVGIKELLERDEDFVRQARTLSPGQFEAFLVIATALVVRPF